MNSVKMVCLRSSRESVTKPCSLSVQPCFVPIGMGQRSARRTSCLCHYSRLHFCQRTSTANPVSPFLWPKGLTQRVRPKATLCRKDVSPPGLPSHAPSQPQVHILCCKHVELVTVSWQAGSFTVLGPCSCLPRRVPHLLRQHSHPMASSPSVHLKEFCVHRVAGTPGLLGMVLSIKHVVFFIALLIVWISP